MRKFKPGLRGKTLIFAVMPALLLLPYNFTYLKQAVRTSGDQQLTMQMQRAGYFAGQVGRQVLADRTQLIGRRLETDIGFNPQLDGETTEWQTKLDNSLFTGTGTLILLAEHGGFAHFLVRQPVGADSLSDQVRLSFYDPKGTAKNLLLKPELPGETAFVAVDNDLLADDSRKAAFAGFNRGGLQLEISLPLTEIDLARPVALSLHAAAQTLARVRFTDASDLHLVVVNEDRWTPVVSNLTTDRTRYWLVDSHKQAYALQSDLPDQTRTAGMHFFGQQLAGFNNWLREEVLRLATDQRPPPYQQSAQALLDSALQGNPGSEIALQMEGHRVISAAQPIWIDGQVAGALLISDGLQDVSSILLDALLPVFFITMLTLVITVLLLITMSTLVVRRLLSLITETRQSASRHGQLRPDYLDKEVRAGDEIGHLVRNISDLLSRLNRHNQFLERMPKTLRHEINNPLNTVSTSLQNLAMEIPESQSSKYMESARRGVLRIGSIVQYLADAVSLEESLKATDKEVIDLGVLLKQYVTNCQLTRADMRFTYNGPRHPIYVELSDHSIEQLMDKIIDNAIDFQTPDTEIKIQLTTLKDDAQIVVSNYGPTLPTSLEENLFDSMVSQRPASKDSRLHFGLGLYVVKIIAEYHRGSVRMDNLEDLSGVKITVSLPRLLARRLRWSRGSRPMELE